MAAEQIASVTRQLLFLLLLSNYLLEGSTASLARIKMVHADSPTHSPHTLAPHFAEGSGVSQALLLIKKVSPIRMFPHTFRCHVASWIVPMTVFPE